MRTALVLCLYSMSMFAQIDPGPRQGPPAAGRPLPNLQPQEDAAFRDGANRYGRAYALMPRSSPRRGSLSFNSVVSSLIQSPR